jgi:C4-dicarboxylate transporter DctQ subunit
LALISDLYNRLVDFFRILAGIVVFLIFAMIVTDVMMRITGLKPWTYISSTVEYGLLWFTMLAAPWLVRIKGHVFIDAITVLLPGSVQKILAKIVYLICIASSVTITIASFDLLVQALASGQIDPRGEEMPLWGLLMPVPLGFGFVTIEFTRYLIGIDTMYGNGSETREGV